MEGEHEPPTQGLASEMRSVRKWFRDVEERLRRLKVTDRSSPEEIRKVFNQGKALQHEIEEQGKEINSLVRRCGSTPDGATTSVPPPTRLRQHALHLERLLHHIWIRSLENQCFAEQLLHRHAAAVTTPNLRDSSEVDSDEGPLKKHPRLTFDCRTAVAATMDRLKKEQSSKGGQRTRDIGVLCRERVPVNDKCIMVGTTGIAALKAEYGDDFTNFEIIQDVGYSSESSTHLSGDDATMDHPFNVRIYQYSKDDTPLNLKQELETVAGLSGFCSLGSSLESSSSAPLSLDDSGLGTGEPLTSNDPGDLTGQFRADDDEFEQEGLDYLATVLDECVDFGASAVSDTDELHFNISGIESDDPSDNFHNRSSFTTSAQVFYKMISVDSDNGEAESPTHDNNISAVTITETSANETTLNDNSAAQTTPERGNENCSSDSDPETFKPVRDPKAASEDWIGSPPNTPFSKSVLCSTPLHSPDDRRFCHRQQGLKRKRDHDATDSAKMSSRVRSWLKRCSDFSSPARPPRKPSSRAPHDVVPQQLFRSEDVSSCDASCECTSSSADEGNNVYSSTSSFFDDDVFKLKTRVDSGSAAGSVETVVVLQALADAEYALLPPPPPSSSASCYSGSKNCSTICCRPVNKVREQCKASSDSDLKKRHRSPKEISNSSSHHGLRRGQHPSTTSDRKLYSSLPNVLRHPSESSTDDIGVPSTRTSYSDTKATTATTCTSSSEKGRKRRRSRKKSSSSNRSSTSVLLSGGDRSRHRSRTFTSSTSRCGSRRRHRSQKSEFFCAEEVFSDEDVRPLKVEVPPGDDPAGVDVSSVLLSPTESDVVLTHLEEQSTVSDQVWDGYQEMPYLSEGYSEATVDEDAVRKLIEFGDDYGSAIGQPVRLSDAATGKNGVKTESPKKCSKSNPATHIRVSAISDDSDSDSEDLHCVIEEAGKALLFARAIIKRRQGGETLTSVDYAELVATCGEHLRCLQTIREHINADGNELLSFSPADLSQLHYLIDEWQDLKIILAMYQDPARQKYTSAKTNIDSMYNKMSRLSSCVELDISGIASWEDVQENLTRLQRVLLDLHEAKEQLLSVNLQVHRFTTEYGQDAQYRDCSLKADITELYRQWEDVYERNGLHLTELETLNKEWEVFDDQQRRLRLRLERAESDDSCDSNTNLASADSLRKDFELLKRSALSLERSLKGGDAWKTIEENLRHMEERVKERDVPRNTTFRSVNHRNPSIVVEEDADDHFEDAIQQLCEDDHYPSDLIEKKDTNSLVPKKRRKSRFWRIVRMAVPVQLALVLLYCLACYMEPSCCNMLNNFNFSLTPQLRYFGGPPPV